MCVHLLSVFPLSSLLYDNINALQEREQADALFKSKKGKQIQKEISKRAKTFVPGAGLEAAVQARGRIFSINIALHLVQLMSEMLSVLLP